MYQHCPSCLVHTLLSQLCFVWFQVCPYAFRDTLCQACVRGCSCLIFNCAFVCCNIKCMPSCMEVVMSYLRLLRWQFLAILLVPDVHVLDHLTHKYAIAQRVSSNYHCPVAVMFNRTVSSSYKCRTTVSPMGCYGKGAEWRGLHGITDHSRFMWYIATSLLLYPCGKSKSFSLFKRLEEVQPNSLYRQWSHSVYQLGTLHTQLYMPSCQWDRIM